MAPFTEIRLAGNGEGYIYPLHVGLGLVAEDKLTCNEFSCAYFVSFRRASVLSMSLE